MLIGTVLGMVGCASTGGGSAADKRQSVQRMKNDVLAELYGLRPKARAEVTAAPGYAVFSNANVNVIFASFGGGYGVVQDNRNGARPI